MSYLQTALTQLMTRHGLKGSDLTRATGLDSATISRWTTGTQISIRDEDLEKLLRVVAHTREEKAELIAARMRDVCKGQGSDLIEIRISEKPAFRESSSQFGETPLPEKYAVAFRILAKNMNDPDVRDLVLSLAGLLDRPEPETAKPNPRKPARVRKLRTLDQQEKN